MDWLYVIAGLGILLFGGDALVKGAVALAMRLGISALVVSLTVVALGTSAPELLVAVQSALDGVPQLALGNVVGSNTANVLLVLGVPALLYGMNMSECHSQKNFYLMIGSTVLFIVLCWTAPLVFWQGAILLLVLIAMLVLAYLDAMSSRERRKELEAEVDDENLPGWKTAMFLVGGLAALPIGAHLLIEGAVNIATDFGVSEAVIGLTLVALGTSLPELATTVMAALRKETDVAVGNVLGSNMFNLLGIIGVAAMVAPIPVGETFFQVDLWVMLGSSLLLAPFILMRMNFSRAWGALFIAGYVAYIVSLIT